MSAKLDDIQSWWEVPSIAYFCSLFRTAFNLLDFDIEELEEALLTDGSEECASTLLTELIVRLLNGCLVTSDVSAFNYQMFLRRLFRQKCQETGRYNPFNTDIDFQFLPLRTKVEILYALCDFRLDADDVFELFKNLEAESLRVEPLGWDDNSSAYWYFYGTRLYREDHKQKSRNKKKKNKDGKRKKKFYGEDWLEDPDTERIWQVICFTESDWTKITEKFKSATSTVEKQLYQSLSENFLPEIPRLFQEKERMQRKRLLELAPRRTSSRVLQKIKLKEEEDKSSSETKETDEQEKKEDFVLGREHRAKRREQLRYKSSNSDSSDDSSGSDREMSRKDSAPSRSKRKKSKNSPAMPKGEPPPSPAPVVKTGRKTNNSLACATGQILIPDSLASTSSNSTRKILKGSQIFGQSEEDIQTDMYKVLEQLTAHEDAWPFMDPVEEEYAPNYYAVIRRPMDLRKMEERLDSGYYADFSAFESDFQLIVNNCRLYNGQDNEYTKMVDNLQEAFDRLTERYVHHASSSDEEIAVEYQIPTPSRKHKMKTSEISSNAKKRKTTCSTSDEEKDETSIKDENTSKKREKKEENIEKAEKKIKHDENEKTDDHVKEKKLSKESRKSKEGKVKKKHKHGKHSKCHKKDSHLKSEKKESKHMKKSKKEKHKKKKHRHSQKESEIVIKRSTSMESLESSNRSRSASPLPSIHTPTPSPSPSPAPSPVDQLSDPDFYKDKYDKIKERRRQALKNQDHPADDLKVNEKTNQTKSNVSFPDKYKNQKLRETIEKLKAKNDKYAEVLVFNNLFPTNNQTSNSSETLAEVVSLKDSDQFDFINESDNASQKSNLGKKDKDCSRKKGSQKVSAVKNEIATEALEQAVKDISKWLDEEPKRSSRSTESNSPQTISTEDQDSRLDDDNCSEKSLSFKKENRKRPSSRETKVSKRRDIHRTIERLHPGKIKGNLIAASSSPKAEDISVALGPHNKPREIKSVLTTKVDELSPKLSLGSVLLAVEFSLGKDHKFSEEEERPVEKVNEIPKPKQEQEKPEKEPLVEKPQEKSAPEQPKVEEKLEEKKIEPEIEKQAPKFSQEKATPNLSAWFKAFGVPKSTPVPKTPKKNEESELEEKPEEKPVENKTLQSPNSIHKYDSPPEEISPTAEGGDSPTPNMTSVKQRRLSTGSSVSERSSFSQDLDSPRLQMAHTSPLLRSPASPRMDDFQKITYPIINGTVRAGFYQDTASVKSSPEKSCSPRDGPQSPYSPYSQHVYANNAASTPNPHSNSDSNKSPLPTYGLNQPPPYYDTSKAALVNKPSRTHDDYTALCPDGLYVKKSGNLGKIVGSSPAHSPYSQHSPRSPYSQINSPQTVSQPSPSNTQNLEPKTPMFPAKKRAYTEEHPSVIKTTEGYNLTTDMINNSKNVHDKEDYQKYIHSMNTFSSDRIDQAPTSVDDIALALSKKSEVNKVSLAKENSGIAYMDKLNIERHEISSAYNGGNLGQEEAHKQSSHSLSGSDKHVDKTSSVDMINMGYFASDLEKRSNISEPDMLNVSRELQKASMNKGFDIGSIAMNLGMNKMPSNKYYTPNKQTPKPCEHPVPNHMSDYDNIPATNQSVSNFGLGDYEVSSKKMYSGMMQSNSPIDYGNWKNDNHARKTDSVHSSYQSNYASDSTEFNKMKSSVPNPHTSNYPKQVHSQQIQNLPVTRPPIIRGPMQHNLPSELRIPNPRGMMNMADVPISSADIMRSHAQSLAMHKSDKAKQTQSLQYKTPYNSQSSSPLDTLRNIPVSYLSNEERYLASFGTGSSLYDKNQMAQMFNKSHPPEAHTSIPTTSIYSQGNINTNKDNTTYKSSTITSQMAQTDKSKQKRKKTDARQSSMSGQVYQSQASTSDVLSSVKNSLVPGSAFNFGPSGMALGGGLYSDSSGFSLEDFRNSTTNQFMAANYMVAAAAAHQRTATDVNVDKLVKPAHQNPAHSGTGGFPFLGHGQTRAAYPFVSTDSSSPLYQQYLQRQEELLGAQIMGLYPPPTYHSGGLGPRQPYDSINRPPWL